MKKPEITTVILTLNEEKNIERSVKSAFSVSKEVIVLDSGSVDNTLNIARELGARCEIRAFTNYADQRNFALGLVNTEWVLFLDADEELSEELKKEILDSIEINGQYYDGFLIPRKNWYLGSFLKCWSPDRLLRLFKTKKGKWVGRVHEKVKIMGKVGYLKGAILHYPFRDLYHQYHKNLNYAKLLVDEKFDNGRKFNIFDLVLRPTLNFLKHYLLKGCFLEGARGLIFSLFYFVYTVQKYSLLYERWRVKGVKKPEAF